MRRSFVGWGLVLVIAVAASWASVGSAAAATPKQCSEAKITTAIVKKVFGPTGIIAGKGVSQTGRCALQSGVHGKAPTGCDLPGKTCVNTDVVLKPASEFATILADEVAQLHEYGHVHKTSIAGSGSGAVLLTASSYGGVTNPEVVLKAGAYTVQIVGPFAGMGEPNAVLHDWETLGRQIYAHLGA